MQVIPSLEIRFNWYNCRALNINILSFRRALFNQAISKISVCLFLSVLLYKYTPTMSQKKKKQRWIIALLLLHSHPSSLLCKTSAFLKLCHISQDKASQLFFLLLLRPSACVVEVSDVLREQRGESDTQSSGHRESWAGTGFLFALCKGLHGPSRRLEKVQMRVLAAVLPSFRGGKCRVISLAITVHSDRRTPTDIQYT